MAKPWFTSGRSTNSAAITEGMLRRRRHIVIHYQCKLLDVQPARRHIRRDHQIDFFLGYRVGDPVANDLAPGRANDITDEENPHGGSVQMMRCGSKESIV